MSPLPKYVFAETTRHGKRVLYFRRGQGSRVRMPDDVMSADFTHLYQQLMDRPLGATVRGVGLMRANYIKDTMAAKIKAALKRDRKLGRKADIDLDWALKQIAAQNHACALTGISFQYQGTRNKRVSPFSPSVDRIDNSKGYEKSNVRIVIAALNLMRLDWGDDVFDMVAMAYIQNKISRTTHPVRETVANSSFEIRDVEKKV